LEPKTERTLIIAKPDAVQRGLVGTILSAFEERGLVIRALKTMEVSPSLAEKHYGVHKGKPFYLGLIDFITSGPVVVGVLEGPDAVAAVRKTMGATRPSEADPGSIRGRYAIDMSHNLIHGSDAPETAEFEINLFFEPHEILEYRRDIDRWIGV
jgi:nucleoside-diphosphate kinase